MSPRTQQQNEQIKEKRRGQVLHAAVGLFVREGFDRTSTAAVAKAANVSHGTVFYYFPTKEELYKAAVLEPLAPTLELMRGMLTGPGSPRERVKSLARLMLASFAREEEYLMLIQQALHLKDRFPALNSELLAFNKATTDLLTNVIAEGQASDQFLPGNPTRLAFCFLAFMNGYGMMVPGEEPSDLILEEVAQTAMRLLIRP